MKWTPLKISLLFVVMLSQLMLLAGYLSYKNLNIILGTWNKSAHLSVYLKTDATPDERNEVEKQIRKNEYVANVDFVDRSAAAKDFEKSFGNYSAGLLSMDELVDLVPESLVVSLKNQLNLNEKLAQFNDIISKTQSLPGVEEVSFGGDWLSKFSQLDKTLRSVGIFILAIVLLSVSFLTALMVRILIEDSRAELEVYSLLGATRWFMYKIFFKEILAFLILSLALPMVSILALFHYFKNIFLVKSISLGFSNRLIFLSPNEIALFCLLVTAFIFLSSFISLRTSLKRLNQFAYD